MPAKPPERGAAAGASETPPSPRRAVIDRAAGESKRPRRSAEESRRRILAAAEQRLIEGGVDAVRLQPIARSLGISDAAIHHHFGSRDGLLAALLRYAGRRLRDRIEAAAQAWTAETVDVAALADLISECYRDRGYARLALFMKLAGFEESGSGMLAELAEALHPIRCARACARDREPPPLADTLHWVALFHTLQVADPLLTESMLRSAGLPDDAVTVRAHRAWVAARLADML